MELYFQLRHKKSGEVTSAFRRSDYYDFLGSPASYIHPVRENREDVSDILFKPEIITRAEYETLLAMYNIDYDDPSQTNETHFWLFTGRSETD